MRPFRVLPPVLFLCVFQKRPHWTIRMAIASTFFVLAAFMNGRRNAFVSDRLIEMVIAKAIPK